jgi:UDPglucose 6-dehydrogenase
MKNVTDYRLIYNPYFIALGSIVNDLENPDLLLIGTEEKNFSFYKNFLKKIYKNKINKIKVNLLNFKEAEISKLAINCYVTMKISFSNSLSQISDKKIGTINTAKILNAIGSDTRIGKKYLGLGPMYSGPCFPRDNLAMLAFFKSIKTSGDLFHSTDKINNLQTDRIIKIINGINKFNNKRVGFLGLTYKSGTDLFTDSPAFYIINKLGFKRTNKIVGYDPYFKEKVKKEISKKYKILIHDTLDTFIKNTDVIFLSYRDKKFSKIIKYKNKVFIDPWNFLNANLANSKIIFPGISSK